MSARFYPTLLFQQHGAPGNIYGSKGNKSCFRQLELNVYKTPGRHRRKMNFQRFRNARSRGAKGSEKTRRRPVALDGAAGNRSLEFIIRARGKPRDVNETN